MSEGPGLGVGGELARQNARRLRREDVLVQRVEKLERQAKKPRSLQPAPGVFVPAGRRTVPGRVTLTVRT